MKIINKLFFPLIIFIALGNIYLFYDGFLDRNKMQKNKKEIFLALESLFGNPFKIEDFSRDNGYAFLYFSNSNKENYHEKLLSKGYILKNDIYCYKKSSLTLLKNEKLLFMYKYPVKICQ